MGSSTQQDTANSESLQFPTQSASLQSETVMSKSLHQGLKIERVFSEENQHPFDSVEFERRTAAIKNHKGEAIFEQKDVEFPTSWSQLATNVVSSKYFYGDLKDSRKDPAEGVARAFAQAAHPPRNQNNFGLGPRSALLRNCRRCWSVLRRADVAVRQPVCSV